MEQEIIKKVNIKIETLDHLNDAKFKTLLKHETNHVLGAGFFEFNGLPFNSWPDQTGYKSNNPRPIISD